MNRCPICKTKNICDDDCGKTLEISRLHYELGECRYEFNGDIREISKRILDGAFKYDSDNIFLLLKEIVAELQKFNINSKEAASYHGGTGYETKVDKLIIRAEKFL